MPIKKTGSSAFTIDVDDIIKVAKGAVLVGSSAALTYVAQNLGNVDFGVYGPVMVPVFSVVLDTVIKWVKNNQE